MSYFYIYKITNTVNNKIYIGQTNDLEQRWAQYRSEAKKELPNQIITRSIKKYGEEKFIHEAILTCRTRDDANHQETLVIAQYDATNLTIGYNIDYGGGATERNPETCAKISASNMGRVSPLKGTITSEETRKKQSISAMGKAGTNTGKIFTPEWTANQSKASAGKPQIHRRVFSDEKEKAICDLYTKGDSSKKLGKIFNVSPSTILTILERNCVPARPSSGGKREFALSKEKEKELCTEYQNGGISRNKLAQKYGCGTTTARDILIRNGVKL